MKRKHILIGVVVVICAGLAVFGLLRMRQSNSGAAADSDDQAADQNVDTVVSVQVGALQRATLHRYLDGFGTIEAAPAMAGKPAAGGPLAASTAGVVAKVDVIPGQHVEKGAILVELNSGSASLDYARAEVARQKKLFAQQNTSLKNLEHARAQLAALEVVSPISGTVTSVNVKPGQAVDVGTVVAEVIDLKRLAVTTKIPAAPAAELRPGQQVQIQATPPVTASLSWVSPTVDPADGTVSAWALLPFGSKLVPGQFIQLRIVTAVHTNCLAAPAESVVTDDQGNSSLWTVSGEAAAKTSVKTGFNENDLVEVSAPGMKEGDKVVTVGAYGLPDKTRIRIVNSSDDNPATNLPAAQ